MKETINKQELENIHIVFFDIKKKKRKLVSRDLNIASHRPTHYTKCIKLKHIRETTQYITMLC